MIGKHHCECARNTDLKRAIFIGLDEAFTALEEACYDLTDEQAWAFPLEGRNNIAWIVMTTLQNFDEYANGAQVGHCIFKPEWRWDLWDCPPEERPKPGDAFPAVLEMLERLKRIRDAAMANLESATEDDLCGKRACGERWPGTAADAYMRTIHHALAHIRQIWLLRGIMGLVDATAWPRQHWA